MVRILVVIWLIWPLAGCSPTLNWREVRVDEAGIGQLFPCKPIRQQRTVELAGGRQRLVLHVCDAGGATWALSHVQASNPGGLPALLDALAAAAQANVGAPPAGPKPHTVPGAAGHGASGRYRFDGQAPDGRPVQVAMLLYARGPVAVQLTVLGSPLSGDAVETFFSAARADR
jgi:hypothetical protein